MSTTTITLLIPVPAAIFVRGPVQFAHAQWRHNLNFAGTIGAVPLPPRMTLQYFGKFGKFCKSEKSTGEKQKLIESKLTKYDKSDP